MVFLFEFKMGSIALETTCNINNTFGPEAANECIMQWRLKKFCKGDENLEDEEPSSQPPEGDNDQLRAIIKADPFYNHTRSWPRIQHQTFYGGSVFEANGRGEKPDK